MIILASSSPRRKELFQYLSSSFEIIPSLIKEQSSFENFERPKHLSLLKAKATLEMIKNRPWNESSFLLAADTIVFPKKDNALSSVFFEAPKHKEEAMFQLQTLSDNKHTVVTGVTIYLFKEKKFITFSAKTKVTFWPLTKEEINWWLSLDHYSDKAGSYAIQGPFTRFIKKIEGCYFNVMGLPLSLTYCTLKKYNRP